MTKIYRVHQEGDVHRGLYRCDTMVDMELQECIRHPTPDQDAALSDFWCSMDWLKQGNYYFGFKSIAQLKSWIYRQEWRDQLHLDNVVISIIECDEAHLGDTQAVFNIRSGYYVTGTLYFNELENLQHDINN